MREKFRKFAEQVAYAAGLPAAFIMAVVIVMVWAVSGPIFHFSDTWQLVINTGTTVVTFLMVFLIQSTQNRESRITALKLDELLRGVQGARTELIGLDQMADEQLETVIKEFRRIGARYAPIAHEDLKEIDRVLRQRRTGSEPEASP